MSLGCEQLKGAVIGQKESKRQHFGSSPLASDLMLMEQTIYGSVLPGVHLGFVSAQDGGSINDLLAVSVCAMTLMFHPYQERKSQSELS